MEIIDMRSNSVDKNIKIGDVLEVVHPEEDRRHEYWFVGYYEDWNNKGTYSLANLETGVVLITTELGNVAFDFYFTGCDIRVVDTELHIVE